MRTDTHLSRALDTADKKIQYDEHVKNLLGNKKILARIKRKNYFSSAEYIVVNRNEKGTKKENSVGGFRNRH